MKRTTKQERRQARQAWRGACQEFGTAYVARTGRDATHHLPLRVASALQLAPWHLFPGVQRSKRYYKYPVVPYGIEAWGESAMMRWTRLDTMAWYTEPMMVVFIDHDNNRVEVVSPRAGDCPQRAEEDGLGPWSTAVDRETAQLWTEKESDVDAL